MRRKTLGERVFDGDRGGDRALSADVPSKCCEKSENVEEREYAVSLELVESRCEVSDCCRNADAAPPLDRLGE